ncbi:zinc ABC transporter ATP-binding protein AztA [Acuticoccus sp. MNP-M23]|uniref:zinc ABC transporter ATP-binding protein AztA n=1 Tax=Acuticoccus sp. MNP-M23 TaxID=3072793 RepID=UPI002815DE76|nr:zinc ABC transporter ATP-binding protein AztA [Acuticoccus sp. MNP-M23]WMS42486.1 zinc ABC transporter ATP-binding protein AztA [Acuticoccus sp. MNP-M23]
MSAPITLSNVTLGYNRHPAVHHLTASFQPGSMTALVGPNGGGKSTLLKALVGEIKPHTGSIEGPPRKSVAYLPQLSEIDRSFPIGVLEVVAMGLWARAGAFGRLKAADRELARGAMAAVGLSGFERRQIGALSGGQMQRVLFARLLLQDCEVILLDEPFAAVDERTIEDLLAIVGKWHAEGRTILTVVHDIDLVRRAFPQTMLLARELVAHGRTADVLSRENISRARTVGEAFDDHADFCRRAA